MIKKWAIAHLNVGPNSRFRSIAVILRMLEETENSRRQKNHQDGTVGDAPAKILYSLKRHREMLRSGVDIIQRLTEIESVGFLK